MVNQKLFLKIFFLVQKSFQDLLRKQEGDRAMWEYPFAVAGVNITFMLIQMLDLEAGFHIFLLSSELFEEDLSLLKYATIYYNLSFSEARGSRASSTIKI